MKRYQFRGYEIHSSRMWQQGQVNQALDFMKKHELNALIFHANDLADLLVFPEKYFDNDVLWDNWPVRRQGLLYRRDYINSVIRQARKDGIDFYIEIKEINAINDIFEIKPDLRNSDGTVCPNHPFWSEFLQVKFTELFEYYPDIRGVIVSPGTRESIVSIAANRCHCERCKTTTQLAWYINTLKAIYEPIRVKGKELIVRDFAYTSEQQELMIDACEKISEEIIISLKAEPHDYYPTFPLNPGVGHTGKLREYIEFDTWGQFFGMGVAPMSLVEDIAARLNAYYDKGAVGVWFRTDWELVNDASVHATPSLVNLYAGAELSKNLELDLDEVYKMWVREGLYSPMKCASCYQEAEHPQNPDAYKKLRDFMKASWKAFAKIGYIQKHQYLESDQPPYTVEKAFEIMTVIHSLEDWEKGAGDTVAVTEKNMQTIFAEKREGLKETRALSDILQIETLGVSKEFADDMEKAIEAMVLFAEFADATTRSMYLLRWAERTKNSNDKERVIGVLEELEKIAVSIERWEKDTFYPYYLYSRLHPQRIRQYVQNVNEHLDKIEVKKS